MFPSLGLGYRNMNTHWFNQSFLLSLSSIVPDVKVVTEFEIDGDIYYVILIRYSLKNKCIYAFERQQNSTLFIFSL